MSRFAATRPAPRRPSHPPRSRFPVLAVAAVGVAVLTAVVLALGLGGGDGDGSSPGVSERRPVSVSGAPLPPFHADQPDRALGQRIPEVSGLGFGATPVEIRPDGRPKLVAFLAHWCPHCRREVPELVDWMAAGAPAGVDVYGVSTAVDPAAPNYPPSAWLAGEGWAPPTIADDEDGTAGAAFGVTGFPFFVAVDGEGRVVARASGEQPVAALEAMAQAARG